jgi:hypothetical protein
MPAPVFELLDESAREAKPPDDQNASDTGLVTFSPERRTLATPSLIAGRLPRLTRMVACGLRTVAFFRRAR